MEKLQVFISWSGPRSHEVAKHLKGWLPDVVRNAEPWLSSEDLRKGLQWLPELSKNLANTGFGLLVLTAENKDAPWLVFEAGVISKALPDKHCCPLLCDLKQSDISGPLAQFQSTSITKKDDVQRLVATMNQACGSGKVDDERLNKWFALSWTEFDKNVKDALAAQPSPAAAGVRKPNERDLLEEILSTVRRFAIEPRPRPEDVFRSMDGPLVAPPELILRDFSRLDIPWQDALLDLIRHGGAISPDMFEHWFQRFHRRMRRAPASGVQANIPKTEPPPNKGLGDIIGD